MKTILVPTDFSDNASNVVEYAAQLAQAVRAKIILFHVYHPPVAMTEMPDVQPMDSIEEDCMEHLKEISENLRVKYGHDLAIEYQCQCGFAVDEIKYYQEHNVVDLIVMGMRGAGYLSERLVGSITTSLIYQSRFPVLTIAENVKFKRIQKIALACDFVKTDHQAVLEPVKNLAKLLGAHIYVLNVVSQADKILGKQDSPEGIALEQALADSAHSIHYLENKDIVEGINAFVHAHDIDLAVMIPRSHSFLENIFQEPNTKRMAFHTDVPLLTLHEKQG